MKNQDHSFAFLTVIILAGLIAACLPASAPSQDKPETDSASLVEPSHASSGHSGISAKF
ncbi:MAG: hypothetical protein H7343_12535 [Undibacterium sp.]|nr:hypothetical protein [Opitutaceae bacterium]